jgi:hypothetical protein
MMGAGWIADAANQMKGLGDGVSQAAKTLQGGGTSALAMKAGLVGLVGVAAFKVGQMIGDWAFETKKYRAELEKALDTQKEFNRELQSVTSRRLDQQIADIKEFGGSIEEQKQAAKEMAATVARDIQQIRERKNAREEELETMGKIEWMTTAGVTLEAKRADIEADKETLKLLKERLHQLTMLHSEAEQEREAKRAAMRQEQAMDSAASALQDQILALQSTREEYEMIKALQVATNDEERERLKLLVEQKQELEKQRKAEEEKAARIAQIRAEAERDQQRAQQELERAREQALRDRERMQERSRQESIRALQEELRALESQRTSFQQTSLTGGNDSRLTQQTSQVEDLARQSLNLTERALKIAETQAKLDAKIEEHTRIMAEKARQEETRIIELIGA